jgi:hypothetical protein
MAHNRYISTNFWKDNYVVDLDPSEKLLFLYFLTNPKTNIAGMYEINLREVAFDTGFDIDMIRKVVERFDRDGKMVYRGGYLILRNWVKHQSLNPSVKRGIIAAYKSAPDWLKEFIITDTDSELPRLAYDSLSTASQQAPTYTNIIESNLTKYNQSELEQSPSRDEDDGEVKKKVAVRTNPKDIDGMFLYWESRVGYPITSNKKKNREFASKILKEHDKQEIAQMIIAVEETLKDKYAPRISNFIDLYYRWDSIQAWGHRRGKSNNGGVVTI